MRLQKIWLNFHVSNKLVSKNYSTKISRSRRFPWWILSVFKDEIILISHKLFQKVEEEGPPKAYGPWWRVLTKCNPLEKGMANYFSILASRTLWTLWEWKKKKKSPVLPITNCVFQDPSKKDCKQRFSVNLHFGGENIQPCAEGRHNAPNSLSEALKEETEQDPSWKQDSLFGWTVDFEPSIYGKDIPTGKPDLPDRRAPGLVPRLSVA